jgi:AraC-like DNA-binding protein
MPPQLCAKEFAYRTNYETQSQFSRAWGSAIAIVITDFQRGKKHDEDFCNNDIIYRPHMKNMEKDKK